MNISSGIAEITLPRSSGPKKVYVWPGYSRERVQPSPQVQRRTESNIPYYKAAPEERDRIINRYRESSYQEYSHGGSSSEKGNLVSPGSLFEAVV